jgi:plastocyanin
VLSTPRRAGRRVLLAALIAGAALLAALIAGAALLAGCGTGGHKAAVPPDGVLVADFAFTPSTLTVHAGDTVTWTFDQPDAPHNVYSTSGPVHFESGTPEGKGTYRFRFTAPGTYDYICQVHPNMHGTVVVTP